MNFDAYRLFDETCLMCNHLWRLCNDCAALIQQLKEVGPMTGKSNNAASGGRFDDSVVLLEEETRELFLMLAHHRRDCHTENRSIPAEN